MRTDGNSTSPRRHSSTRSPREPELVAVPGERPLDVRDDEHEMIEPDDSHVTHSAGHPRRRLYPLGRPRMRSPMIVRCTSDVPPAIDAAFVHSH